MIAVRSASECHNRSAPIFVLFDAATLLKTEAGGLPEGKVKIRLESDGSLLDVDEDDVEKVFDDYTIATLATGGCMGEFNHR